MTRDDYLILCSALYSADALLLLLCLTCLQVAELGFCRRPAGNGVPHDET
jgi:hypothetical protein